MVCLLFTQSRLYLAFGNQTILFRNSCTMDSSPVAATSTLISIGSHSLCLYSCGPSVTNFTSPAVLLISGLASSNLGWSAVTRLLSPSIRVYSYDRSGYGSSETSPLPPTAENIATELNLLLQNAKVEGPLILVAHSWGGVIVQEFLLQAGNGPQIAGLVLVDANQERTLEVLDWRDANLRAVGKDLDLHEVTGINSEHKLTGEEWKAFLRDEATSKHLLQAENEAIEYGPSFNVLVKKGLLKRNPPLLGDKPVCIIMAKSSRDFERIYKAGVEKGNGTEEERRASREYLRTWDEKHEGLQRGHLNLSSNGRFVVAGESGHHVQLTQPDVVADAVKWVLKEFLRSN
jgi:pimeloyl-ACP methyl ester carboxylesterase